MGKARLGALHVFAPTRALRRPTFDELLDGRPHNTSDAGVLCRSAILAVHGACCECSGVCVCVCARVCVPVCEDESGGRLWTRKVRSRFPCFHRIARTCRVSRACHAGQVQWSESDDDGF